MAGRQLAALGRRLAQAGWPADTPILVVSRAGWPDQLQSDHLASTLAEAAVLHAGRPTVVTVGVGAAPLRQTTKAQRQVLGPVPDAVPRPARREPRLQP